jgi:hypothetical protein
VHAQLAPDASADPALFLTGAAITENCCVWCRPPHCGQMIFSLDFITSFSNGFLQSSQWYSYIGICVPS